MDPSCANVSECAILHDFRGISFFFSMKILVGDNFFLSHSQFTIDAKASTTFEIFRLSAMKFHHISTPVEFNASISVFAAIWKIEFMTTVNEQNEKHPRFSIKFSTSTIIFKSLQCI